MQCAESDAALQAWQPDQEETGVEAEIRCRGPLVMLPGVLGDVAQLPSARVTWPPSGGESF
jgi:hypothetical protein